MTPVEALRKLLFEAIHYRDNGIGVQFLNKAIEDAQEVLKAETAIAQRVDEPPAQDGDNSLEGWSRIILGDNTAPPQE